MYAADWDTIGEVVGMIQDITTQAYQARQAILDVGENIAGQNQLLNDTVQKKGIDNDIEHSIRVSSVMNQLIDKGEYALRPNSLPFRWRVVEDKSWNASCYPNDFIAVNSAIVKDLNNDDMLAAVLAHEMTHGLHQHIANDEEKQVYYNFGTDILNYNANELNSRLLNYLSNYVETKNTTNTSEADADETGFYIMSSAGFNPGGFPAMILHMENVDHSNPNFKWNLLRRLNESDQILYFLSFFLIFIIFIGIIKLCS